MRKGEKFEFLMKEKGFNKSTLSTATGIAYTTIDSMIKRDFQNASIDAVILLAKALDIEVSEFIPEAAVLPVGTDMQLKHTVLERQGLEHQEIFQQASRSLRMKEVEYLEQVSVGEHDSLICDSKNQKIELPKFIFGKYAHRKDTYVMKAFGDSMNKIIPNGSFVICIPIENHKELNDGDIVVYTYENESSMKRYHERGDRIVFSPESHNRDFYDFVVSKDTINEIKIYAKVIAYHVILE